MRFPIITLLAWAINSCAFAQSGFTSYSVDLPMKDSLNVELLEIEKSEFPFYFRLRLSGQTIDIYSSDNKTYRGEINSWIKEYKQIKTDGEYRSKAVQLYLKRVEIDSLLAKSIALRIINSGQPELPTDELIESWKKWFLHCGSVNFEIKNKDRYVEQSYHCPWNQPDSVEFKDIILSNFDILKQELHLDSLYQELFSQLPKGKTYSRSGYSMTYILTEKQEEQRNKDKPRRIYLKSIKDTVDNYLNTKLDELQNSTASLKHSCFSGYSLTFGKNGKLIKVRERGSSMKISDGLFWYLEDVIEERRCIRQTKKIFKSVNLKTFNLEHKVYRTFYYDLGDGWIVVDNTIY